jgi:hypothetical protein
VWLLLKPFLLLDWSFHRHSLPGHVTTTTNIQRVHQLFLHDILLVCILVT